MKKSKIYLCLLAGTTILSLAGCGSKKDPSSSLSSNTPASDSPSSEISSSETKSAYSVTYDLNYEGERRGRSAFRREPARPTGGRPEAGIRWTAGTKKKNA